VVKAGPVRLRPIVMTSMATVFGAVPLAFGIGPGSETRAPLAQSIIGGSILATSVTLLVVPVFYVIFERFGAWLRRLSERDGGAEKAAGASVPPVVAASVNGANGHVAPAAVALTAPAGGGAA
jgi:HAE1 family hydrophobic/amphiphilic exporter-1